MTWRARLLVWCLYAALCACRQERHEAEDEPPSYVQVAPLLKRACSECHGGEKREGDYALDDLWSVQGCTANGKPATQPDDDTAPLIAVLARDDHRDLVSSSERALLSAWVAAGAPARRNVLHARGILDPRSPDWHGQLARKDDFRALRDASDEAACGRCHAGAPVAPRGKTGATDGATACTSCHQQPKGVLACSTCHGKEERSYPPRDACYFGGPERDPHAAHVATPKVRKEPLSCATCHPVPTPEVFAGAHADGKVDLTFSSPLLDESATRAEDGSCSVACHARGGERAQPTWEVASPLDCQSCHLSPPTDHPPGRCDTCHANMGASPDSLKVDALHMNGQVDVGDRRGTCGSCHGKDDSGAPNDVGHSQHLGTLLTQPIACTTCHAVPSLTNLHQPATHMNGRADVSLSGRAQAASGSPSYAQNSCAQVACHADALVPPRWGQLSQASSSCAACHATPPPPPHSTEPGCGGGLCHGAEVAPLAPGFRITESGRSLHIDGKVQAGGP